jgi:hypothetical protein
MRTKFHTGNDQLFVYASQEFDAICFNAWIVATQFFRTTVFARANNDKKKKS